MIRTSLIVGTLLTSVALGPSAGAAEWVSLFDGSSLKGWVVKPTDRTDGHWIVQDGCIVAENPNEVGSNLWTEMEYRNFEFEMDYQTPSEYYDTGVFVRGESHQVQIGISGSLQVDMTGCIYAPADEQGSYPARSDKIESVHRVGEWNRIRVVVTGNRIQTFLNDEAFVDYEAFAVPARGPIGLQLHPGHHMKILFKNIRVRELPAVDEEEDGFVPLFDGNSIDGWVQNGGKAKYEVENGEIVGTSVPITPNSFLCTPRDYGDFELRLQLKVDPPLNSGIQIRSHCYDEERVERGEKPNGEPWEAKIPAGRVHGYQVEIDPSDRAWSGGIYDEARRGWLYDLSADRKRAARRAFKRDGWNEYRIRAVGDRIQTWVNGVPIANLQDDLTAKGLIALQVHGVGDDEQKVGKQVRWRNLRIKEL